MLQLVGLHAHSKSEGRVNDHRQAEEAYRTDRRGSYLRLFDAGLDVDIDKNESSRWISFGIIGII